MSSPLLEVQDLGVRFRSEDGDVVAVSGVDFELALGETLCLLGESGSGKTVTMRALMRLLPPDCAFAPRRPRATDICTREAPALVALGQDRRVRCHLVSS